MYVAECAISTTRPLCWMAGMRFSAIPRISRMPCATWFSWTKDERVSPVVKEERYFAPNDGRAGRRSCRGSELLGQRRSLELQSTGRYRAPSRLSSWVPRRVFEITSLAGGEDYGYFA